jgi:uncharacterized membrane protein YqaE (UPF0057 family)
MSTSAEQLARAYDRYVSALWRGESEEVRRFASWLKGCWALGGPPEPSGPAAAVSALGGAGTSIRWYDVDGTIVGYIPGVPHRCYQVPTDADPPVIAAYRDVEAAASRRPVV